MRFLRGYALTFGAILLVVGAILSTFAPEHTLLVRGTALLGLVLFVVGLVLNFGALVAFVRGRRVRAAGASGAYTLTVLAVLVLVTFLASRHHVRRDFTETQQFSLSEQTIKVLETLPREVTVTAFYPEAEPSKQKFDDLMTEYRYRSPKLTVRSIDPYTHPGDAKRYGISEANTIVVESGKNESRATAADEESITNAIIKVTKDREKVVYFTQGHGERSLTSSDKPGLSLLKGELEKQHYTVKPLVLGQGIPADASVVVVAGPEKALFDAEVKILDDYLKAGGHVLHLQDPGADSGLDSVLAEYGLALRNDVVVDKVSRLFGGDYLLPLVPADGYDEFHPITKTFRLQTIFPLARSVEIKNPLPEGVSATKLAQTSPLAWAQPDNGELKTGKITLREGSGTAGPVPLAAVATRKVTAAAQPAATSGEEPKAPETRLVVFGDSDFVTNGFFNASGDGDLALNAIAWLSEQEELASIRPKTSVPRTVILSRQQVLYYFFTIVAVAPLAITIAGVAIWWRRKKL